MTLATRKETSQNTTNNVLYSTSSRIYNDKVMSMLLTLLKSDPPLRTVTFKFL